jgi:hypothetical protein
MAHSGRSEQDHTALTSPAISHHFPTFHLGWKLIISVCKWVWRRHRAFVNALVVVVLSIVVLYACWEYVIGTQRNAVAAIIKADGAVSYDWEWKKARPVRTGTEPPWPRWVVNLLGPDFCGRVVAVYLSGSNADDALLIHVGRLTRLQHLNLYGNIAVTGTGLVHLENLTALEELVLPEFPFSDNDLAHLAGLSKLKSLDLSSDRISNAGLLHLANMRQLESLSLRKTRITTLEPIRGLTQLTHLDLSGSPIDDEGLRPLECFTGLQTLLLSQTRVTDVGIAHLSGLSSLMRVELNETSVGDAGARLLVDLPLLNYLNLYDTQVTDPGLASLAPRLNRSAIQFLVVPGQGAEDLQKNLPRVQVVGHYRGGSGIHPIPRPQPIIDPPPPNPHEDMPQ